MNLITKIKIKYYDSYYKTFAPYLKVPVTFIVSSGRTGTNFFESFLNNVSSDIKSVHEPFPSLFSLGLKKIRQEITTEEIINELISGRKRLFYESLAEEKSSYVESNPFASLLIPEIKMAFPQARFLYIHREPFSYIKSIMNKKNTLPDGHTYYPYGESDRGNRMNPFDFKNEPYQSEWKELSRYEKVAWYWQKINLIILNDLSQIPAEQQMSIKFEDLFFDKIKFKETVSFLNSDIRITESDLESLMRKKSNVQTGDKFEESKFLELNNRIEQIIRSTQTKLNYT